MICFLTHGASFFWVVGADVGRGKLPTDQSRLHDLLYFELLFEHWHSHDRVTISQLERANCILTWKGSGHNVVPTRGGKAVPRIKMP